jgi:hypothetical protein
LGPPFAVVAVARTVWAPAERVVVTVVVVQVVQAPVPAKDGVDTVAPSTAMVIGRLVVVPLAKRKTRDALPAVPAVTDHSTQEPTSLV